MIPLLVAKIKKIGGRLSDIEYLAVQQFNNNIIRLSGDINSLNDTLTHTVSVNKDAYVLVAKITPTGFTLPASNRAANGGTDTNSNNHTEAKISINNIEIDRTQTGIATRASSQSSAPSRYGNGNGTGYGSIISSVFEGAIGAKALPTQQIQITNTSSNGTCKANLVILEVDQGTSPAL